MNGLAVELDVDVMRFRLFGGEGYQASSAPDDLNVVRDLSFIDRNFQLSFAGLAGVDLKLTRLSDDAVRHVRDANQPAVVHFGDERSTDELRAADAHLDHVAADFLRRELHSEFRVAFFDHPTYDRPFRRTWKEK